MGRTGAALARPVPRGNLSGEGPLTLMPSEPANLPPAAPRAPVPPAGPATRPFGTGVDELGRVGQYRLLGVVGKGSVSRVFKAEGAQGQIVALKLITENPTLTTADLQRFQRESDAAFHLGQHPNIVKVYDRGSLGRSHFIAMELVADGRTLQHLLAERKLSVSEALGLAIPMAEALAFAHSRGVIHRDLKPANILINAQGQPLLSDFGLAKAEDSVSITVTGELFGTPRYMSPEQARHGHKQVTAQSDIYSFGLILYELLTGASALVFTKGMTFSEILKLVCDAQVRPVRELQPAVSPHLARVLHRMLARDCAHRYTSLAPVLAELRLAQDYYAHPGDPRQATRYWVATHRRELVVGAVAAAAVVAALAGYIVYRLVR